MSSTELEPAARAGELAAAADGITFAIEAAKTLVIRDDDDVEIAAELLSQITAASKAIEEKRVELTAPINAVVKKLNAAAKEAQGELPDVGQRLRQAIGEYRTSALAARTEAKAAAQESSGQAVVDPGGLPSVPEKRIQTSSGTVGERTYWTFELVDAHAFVKACSKTKGAWEKDGDMVMAAVSEINDRVKKHGLREFPGLRIFEKSAAVVR
jgi:hypothetical protein